ncbi:MAG: hypothetical protein WBE26_03045 [Phycisphaerae bacterium]
MALYAGIDLHSTNNVVVVLDEKDKVVDEVFEDPNVASAGSGEPGKVPGFEPRS